MLYLFITVELENLKNLCRKFITSAFAAGQVLCSMSLFIMTLRSVDRLLAMLLGLSRVQTRCYAQATPKLFLITKLVFGF